MAERTVSFCMGQLDIHDDKIRREHTGLFQGQTSVAHAFNRKLVRAQQIGEQFEVQFIILNNHHLF
jgi:hypothetical protein